jgi:FdrA protein
VITATAFARVVRGRYVDSVVLMRLAQRLLALPGVVDAAALMGTDANKKLLAEGEFVAPEIDAAGPNDLVVAVKGDGAVLERLDELLGAQESAGIAVARTLEDALALQRRTNLVVVSTPGEYAATEARRALERGLHVFVFSSNVSLEDELELKLFAREHGLLCMGPDCGTALVAGKGIGFANVVRRGPVGVVGAAGTGIQAITSLLDRFGVGVSHAIGAGGRDTSDAVGGATTFAGLAALLEDNATEAIVLVSKPPGPETAARIRAAASAAPKPVICCFLDAMTLEEAARAAADAVGRPAPPPTAAELPPRPARGRFIRGLYAGGSLASEARLVLSRANLPSNNLLQDRGHAIADLGAEEFVRGRPHPMIDSRERRAQLAAVLADPDTAVVLLDVVLGYGAAADPAGDLADVIAAAGDTVVLASVLGTEGDPQGLHGQERVLREAGAHVLSTNAAAAGAAAELVS